MSELGVKDQYIPDDLERRSAKFRSLLNGKRIIILADNIKNADQLRPLLPNTGASLVIATSRKELSTIEGSKSISLEVFTPDEAKQHVESVIGADKVTEESKILLLIAELCGHLPLALRIAASTLKRRPHWTLEYYHQKLSDEYQRLSILKLEDLGIRSSLGISYSELNPYETKLFSFLGMFKSNEFDLWLAGVLTNNTDEATVDDALNNLSDNKLLEALPNGRYRFHTLVLLYAREKLEQDFSTEEQKDAIVRLGNFLSYWSSVYQAALLKIEGFNPLLIDNTSKVVIDHSDIPPGVALNWFEVEKENIELALLLAYSEKEWEIVRDIVNNISHFLYFKGYWSAWEQVLKLKLEASTKLNDTDDLANTYGSLGLTYNYLGKTSEALHFFDKAYKASKKVKNLRYQGVSILNKGNVYINLKNFKKAEELFKIGKKLMRKIRDKRGEAQALGNLSQISSSQGKYKEALNLAKESLELLKIHGGLRDYCKALDLYSHALKSCGQVKEAEENLFLAINISKEINDEYTEAGILDDLADLQYSNKEIDKAIETYRESLRIYKLLGAKHQVAKSASHLGMILYENKKCVEESITLIKDAIVIFEKLGDRESLAKYYSTLTNIYYELKDYENTLIFCDNVLQVLDDKMPDWRAMILFIEGETYHRMNNYHEAKKSFDDALILAKKIKNPEFIANAHHGIGKVLRFLDDPAGSQYHLKIALDLFSQIHDPEGVAKALHSLCHSETVEEFDPDNIENSLLQCIEIFRTQGDVEGLAKAGTSYITFLAQEKRTDEIIPFWKDILSEIPTDTEHYGQFRNMIQSKDVETGQWESVKL